MTNSQMYRQLDRDAKDTIHAHRFTIVAYVRSQFPDGVWGGDTCGCFDDRCRDGYHHETWEECGCLPVILAEARGTDTDHWASERNPPRRPGAVI